MWWHYKLEFREYCARRAARSLVVSDDSLSAGFRAGVRDLHRVVDCGRVGLRERGVADRPPGGPGGLAGRAKVVVIRGKDRKALRIVVQFAVIPVWAIRMRRTWIAAVRRSDHREEERPIGPGVPSG